MGGPPAPGWGMPGSAPPYPTQPVAPYPMQPHPVEPPPPYSAQPAFAPHPTFAPQPGAYPQPVLNASSGGCPIQPGPGARGTPGMNTGFPKNDSEALPEHFGASFSDKAIRNAFIRKVYLILMAQLLVTLCFVCLFTFHSGVRKFVHENFVVYMLSYAVFLVTYLTLVCCSGVRRKWPGNFIMLGIFTLSLSYLAGAIASYHDTKIVVMTIGITCAICLCLTLFATQTKYDFTGCGIYLFVAAMVLFIFGIIAIFTYSKILYTVYSAGIALLFSMYLVFDTQMIVGGRKHEMSPEEHIFGALVLYLDVINIFIALLYIFGGKQ
ncbi:hypothetical protein Pcinc_018125 [Petrolisthes cinctipes]|uniref:Uncharacterized protein n=1 Tax=Petrolisthes cinctipes TaxID=88211 RepID=A0AAE1FQ07_PETCI|nr:hypothetical protein Pcinc_018125 [Petrolisthes cinctipes]